MSQEPRRPRAPRRRAVPEAMVDEVAAIVPQAGREVIRRDLEQTHNTNATVERLLELSARGELPEPAPPAATASASGSRVKGSLLGHYKLTGDETVPETTTGWKGSREEREAQLKAQRQAMILRARNNMKAS